MIIDTWDPKYYQDGQRGDAGGAELHEHDAEIETDESELIVEKLDEGMIDMKDVMQARGAKVNGDADVGSHEVDRGDDGGDINATNDKADTSEV